MQYLNTRINRTIIPHFFQRTCFETKCDFFLVKKNERCYVGDRCNSYTKGIGLTLDDILRNEVQLKTSLNDQSILIKMSVVLITVMFVGGLINSVLSILTFQSAELRKVGCGMYLLSSSITSLLTVCMLVVKFWFVVLTQMSSCVRLSVIQGGCVSIEPLLKVFLYIDTWLNACVTAERAVSVSKGVKFDKKKSKRIARWIIIILPLFVIGTIIHEPIHRHVLEYATEKYKPQEYENWTNVSMDYEMENHVLCLISYSHSMQNYNTVVLFFHLIMPFVANFFSALYIIFGTARQRSITRTQQTYTAHIMKQFNEHKQLVISPIAILILSLPRLIFSLVSGCVDASKRPWLYLCGYFISFTPSMLIFVIFVLPSELYKKTFTKTVRSWRHQTHR